MATITAADVAAIEALHGATNIREWTNVNGSADPASSNTTVLEIAMNDCLERMAESGHTKVQTDPDVYRYTPAFLHPSIRMEMLTNLMEEFERRYCDPKQRKTSTTVSTTALAFDDDDSVSKFDDDRWGSMRRVGRNRNGSGGGF